ncbi:MAG: hypothetical protein ACON5H_02400 [Akkermansiaceae bacterium]
MNRILALLSVLGAGLFLSSCTDYDTYNTGSGYGSYGYQTAHVGIIRTSNSYWGYDPYRRSYYDYRCRRYYNPYTRNYCTSVPRRYPKPVYPSGYRSGRPLSCPSSLNRVHYKNDRTNRHTNFAARPNRSDGIKRSAGSASRGQRQPIYVSTSKPPATPRTSANRGSSRPSYRPRSEGVSIHSTSMSSSRQPSRSSARSAPRPPTLARSQPTRSTPPAPTRSAPRSVPAQKSKPAPSIGRSSGSPQRSHRR